VKEVKIQRDTVIVPSVSGDFLTGTTIGYIELAFFGEHTTEEFTDTLGSLIGSGATGIIIDGRNNGGGYLDSAVDVLSTVLPENQLVVATRGINPAENIDYKTKKRKIQNTQIPIIMIVNNMSASATEIVA
jgi:carboxyl-terminal processing protease